MTEEDSDSAPPAYDPDAPPQWTESGAAALEAMLPQYDQWEVIGHGGMGAVYRARQASLDRPVAIKVLPPQDAEDAEEFTQRFKNEARTMAKLTHPAIVAVHDFGETADGQLYFAMEYIDGTDVHKMIHAQGRLPPEHALAITAHVCDALAYAHEHGVMHRDIKPANILINMEGAVKVADFGLAGMQGAVQQEGTTMGTPDYVAPEVLTLGATVDGRADLYAVGVMLYNMLTGEIPRHACMPASQKCGCSSRFDAIIRKAMEPDVADRYQTAREIRQDLDRILTVPVAKAQAQAARPPPDFSPRKRPEAPPPQSPPPWGLVAAAVVVLGGGAFFLLKGGSPATPTAEVETAQTEPATVPPAEANPEAKAPEAATTASTPPPASAVVVDPNAPKGSDLSQFPVLSHGGHHYQVVQEQISFANAQKHAESLHAHLATITSQEEQSWLEEAMAPFVQQAPQAMVTIGAQQERDGQWKWVTGEPFEFTQWTPGHVQEPQKHLALKITLRDKRLEWGAGLHDSHRAFLLEWDSAPKTPPPVARVPAMPPPVAPPVIETEGAKRIRELDAQFRVVLERDVLVPYRASLATLNGKYVAAIDRALSTSMSAPNSPETLALQAEKQRVARGDPLPLDDPPDLPEVMKTLRGTYRTSVRPIETTRNNGLITFFGRFDTVLKGLEAEWGKAQKPDEARRATGKLLQITRERLALMGEIKEYVPPDTPLVLKGRTHFTSPENFQPPVEFSIVAKTDKQNLRLAHAARQVIFNWEVDPDELRVDAYTGASKHVKGQGRIPEDTYVTIHWLVLPQLQIITVDGKRRCLHFGEYGGINRPIEVFPFDSTVTVKSLKARLLGVKGFEDQASSVPEMKPLFVNRANWTGQVSIPPGRYAPIRRITVGAPGLRDPKAQYDEQRGDVTSQTGAHLENARFHLQEGSWKASGSLFRDVKITADLGGSFEAKDSLFQDCVFAKEGPWYIALFSSKWNFTNCVFTGSFMQNWKVGDVGMKLNGCTFNDVDFTSIQFKEDAGAEVAKEWMKIEKCRFIKCRVPESLALATRDCVFVECTFGTPEEKLPLKSELNTTLFLHDTINMPQAGTGRMLNSRVAEKAPAGVGASLKHRLEGGVLGFE